MTTAGVRTVRIDVPLRTTPLYFFVHPEDRRWGEWWGRFFDYLLTFLPESPQWSSTATGADLVSRQLTTDETARLVEHLTTAPEEDRLNHRSLKKALERLPGRQATIVYFRTPPS